MARLVLIDAHAILHRAYHALPTSGFKRQGRLINAVYGFFSMLLKAIEELRPDYLIVCFDAPGPTFRHEQFVGYQANRPKITEELGDQIDLTRESVKKIGLPVFLQPGFEADDLIGTIIRKTHRKKGKNDVEEIIVVTGDRDLMQLVDERTKLFLLTQGVSGAELIDPAGVEARLGIRPEQVVDYKALVGDSSDNYPGVAGIGPKTAVELLKRFGQLTKIWSHLEEIEPKIREKLERGRESAELSYRLAQINCRVPIKLELSQASWNREKQEKLRQVLNQLGFPSLIKRLDQTHRPSTSKQLPLL